MPYVDSSLVILNHVDMVRVADVSELHTPSSFRDQVDRMSEFPRICIV
jgi:hypothetical protein